MSNAYGRWYRLSPDGRFVPLSAAAGDADDVCVVTFQSNPAPTEPENEITQWMNAAASVPIGGTRRWTVDALALKQAYDGGATVALTPV